MQLERADQYFYNFKNWTQPVNIDHWEVKTPPRIFIDPFDQNGYDLCILEQEYAQQHHALVESIRWRKAIAKPWYLDRSVRDGGPHINHAKLFERKGFEGAAKAQLIAWAEKQPLLWKLIKMKPKWGIDISFDYVDFEGNVFELFHYEWDAFDLEPVLTMQARVEDVIENTDWNEIAKTFIARREEWQHLPFFEQSEWKSTYLGLPPENFKMVLWEI